MGMLLHRHAGTLPLLIASTYIINIEEKVLHAVMYYMPLYTGI